MQIRMHDESDLTLTGFTEPGLEVTADAGAHAHYSALQMFGASLGLCTASVLASYAERLEVGVEDLSVHVRWTYVDEPFRVGSITLNVRWPSLPESRLQAAQRAAAQCTLHNTLHHPPQIETVVTR